MVDDEALVGLGLKMILETAGGFTVAVSDGRHARSAVEEHRPMVVLLESGTARLAVLDELCRLHSPPAVAMLTTLAPPDLVLGSLRGGACGFLLKDSQPEQLVAAVRALATGATVLAPEARSIVLHAGAAVWSAPGSPAARVRQLSNREQTILRLLGQGLTNAEISRESFLSESTVKEHVSAILSKLGVVNRVQAAVRAQAAGLMADDLALGS